jgi:hypothetical protein
MRFNLKRFTIGAILLATLSLLLQGCGNYHEKGALSDTTPPPAPANFAVAVGLNPVLSWTASTDAGGGVVRYLVYRAGASGPFILLGTVDGVTYTDTAAAAGTTYSYKVVAFDAARNLSPDSSTVTVTTPTVVTPGITTYTVSGRVTYNGAGVQGVVITITGTGYGSAITGADGTYIFPKVLNGSYSISAALTSSPTLQFVVDGANVGGLDFITDAPGAVNGGVTYPTGTIIGGITYPAGTVIGGVTYPTSTVIGGVIYPTGTVVGGVTYPNGVVIGGVTYPNGVVIGGVTYPNGVVIGGVTYPPGTVVGGVVIPPSTVPVGVTYPTSTVSGGITYPNGIVAGGVTYPAGTVTTIFSSFTNVIVSGRVATAGGVGLSGVVVDITGAGGGSATTGPMGYYYISVVSGGTYAFTATPPATPYVLNGVTYNTVTLSPVGTTPTNPISTNSAGQNFEAALI